MTLFFMMNNIWIFYYVDYTNAVSAAQSNAVNSEKSNAESNAIATPRSAFCP